MTHDDNHHHWQQQQEQEQPAQQESSRQSRRRRLRLRGRGRSGGRLGLALLAALVTTGPGALFSSTSTSLVDAAAASFAHQSPPHATPPTGPPLTSPILRVPMENYDQMQFFGHVTVGSPPQAFRVIFDTGSSDVWLPDATCDVCAGPRRYRPEASSTFEPTTEGFRLEYGSGNASGLVMRETLRLGGQLELARVPMGRVNETTKRLQSFHADGIVGLGLESLALVTTPGLFGTGLLSSFSVFINALPDHEPPSQLILGGVDPTLVPGAMPRTPTEDGHGNDDSAAASIPSTAWHWLPLVPFPSASAFGFWAVRLDQVAMHTGDDDPTKPQGPEGPANEVVIARTGTAIIDSGTSLLLLPPRVFETTIAELTRHLAAKHHVRLAPSADAISGVACTGCTPAMFPPLAFALGSGPSTATTFVLQGRDYVRCEGASCSPQLDVHGLFGPDGGGNGSNDDVLVLGAIFLRAYYTHFDASRRHVAIACARGRCEGGWNVELRFSDDGRGRRVLEDGYYRRFVLWRRVYLSVGTLLLVLAGVLMWLLVGPSASSTVFKATIPKLGAETDEEEDDTTVGADEDETFWSRPRRLSLEVLRRLSIVIEAPKTVETVSVVDRHPAHSMEEEPESEPPTSVCQSLIRGVSRRKGSLCLDV